VTRYMGVRGVRVEELGDVWAAYSPASGETHLINDESAVLLEWLISQGPADAAQAALSLSADVGVAVETLQPRLEVGWGPLLSAGLIRRVDKGGYPRSL
jgi:hypothetical protein